MEYKIVCMKYNLPSRAILKSWEEYVAKFKQGSLIEGRRASLASAYFRGILLDFEVSFRNGDKALRAKVFNQETGKVSHMTVEHKPWRRREYRPVWEITVLH